MFGFYGKPKRNKIKKYVYNDLEKLIDYTNNLLHIEGAVKKLIL